MDNENTRETSVVEEPFESYKVRVTVTSLNVRANPDKNAKILRTISSGNYTIVKEKNNFGLLKSGGWISLDFVNKV